MILKKRVAPQTRRRFSNAWMELDYLCKKVRYWLYTRGQKARANHYADRLENVLAELPDNDVAIIRHEGLALLNELRENLVAAIRHRKTEIELIERLHRESRSQKYDAKTRAYMLRDLDGMALEIRKDILISLEKRTRIVPRNGAVRRQAMAN